MNRSFLRPRSPSPPLPFLLKDLFENARRASVGVIQDSNDSKIQSSETPGFAGRIEDYPAHLGALSCPDGGFCLTARGIYPALAGVSCPIGGDRKRVV